MVSLLKRQQLDLFTGDHTGRLLDDVSPRYLAGPGDARHVTHALAAAGWILRSDPLAPVVDLVSPDLRYRLRHEPGPGSPRLGWHLDGSHAEGTWYASFGAVPVEILAGFTDQVLLAPPAADLPDVWAVLADAGWTHTRLMNGDEAHSPDGTVHIEKRPICDEADEVPAWRIEVRSDPGYGPPIWTAWIAHAPPPHVVHGLVTALVDPAPLQRNWQQDAGHYSARRTESSVTATTYVQSHLDRIDTVRALVQAARRRAKKTLTNTPASTPPAPSAPVRQAR
ncbi:MULTISPECIES: DUF317 domain-containing protein [Streptomyces]|uniref:DUF317 domain-containing protein n=1 Tax=Streptomyces TaxID=1883 RepID=UPI00025CE2AD|nr:DUF317 domain-containing protein [Streptomyces tsukubensis]EIF93132.1 hypothetical protein [Streptomyces tsukubensis NRRL18488]MYS66529.1 DUF317 domain-containing protein [Streptomyces sp. SID5473]